MEIKGFIENSLLEWEGRLSCVIFLPGCNLRCAYCHAGYLLDADKLPTIPRQTVFDALRKHTGWLDAAVITGGEPTLHGEELVEFIQELRDLGVEVMVETNGTRPEFLESLMEDGYLDAVSMDVKAPLTPQDYRRVTGTDVDMGCIRRSIRAILDSGVEHEFRVTVVPGLIGREELARIAPELKGAQTVALQNFQPTHCLSHALCIVRPYMPEQMDALGELMEPFAERVIIRGREHALAPLEGQ